MLRVVHDCDIRYGQPPSSPPSSPPLTPTAFRLHTVELDHGTPTLCTDPPPHGGQPPIRWPISSSVIPPTFPVARVAPASNGHGSHVAALTSLEHVTTILGCMPFYAFYYNYLASFLYGVRWFIVVAITRPHTTLQWALHRERGVYTYYPHGCYTPHTHSFPTHCPGTSRLPVRGRTH